MLILGVSGCIFLPLIKLISPSKLIVNIDGLEWRRGKWGNFAKWFLKFSEKCAVGFADVVVADNLAILKYIKETYCKDSALIPYGGDQAKLSSLNLSSLYPNIDKIYAFKVCRIEPENNLDIILEAFIHLDLIQLVIVGNWSNSEYGTKLRKKYCTFKNMHLLDPIYDVEKLNCLRSSCSFYIHGHSAGGTNPSLLEAMHLSLPIIAFDCEFNRETTENKALFFEDASTLRSHLLSTNAFERSEISLQMKNIANCRYTWEIVSKQYADLFSS
jgi:glycosyltransferase involved in cell wall biosynthesis